MGGGPPARRPRCELRSARRLEARPGPAAAHGHRSLAPQAPPAPSTPVGPGRWCVAGCVVSKPGQALPPPTGTAARPRVLQLARALRSLRRPPHQWDLVCWRVAWCAGLLFGQALPPPTGTAARPRVLQLARALRSLRRPPLRWCCVAGVWLGASSRSPARPRRSLGASWGSRVLSFWGARVRVVTNVVNLRAFSLKMLVFGLRLTTFVTGVLVRQFELRWFDDVCNVCR